MKFNKSTTEQILLREVTNNIKYFHKLVLAFSGGLDSTVLLDILYNINNQMHSPKNNKKKCFKLRAIHIHHGLNHNADYWAKHCFEECEKRNIQLDIIYINCNENKNNGIEATARQIRYQYLFNNLYQQEILITAHHLDDQVETFLLALKRGSGPTGLSSMPKKKILYNYQQLLRPLLKCTKEQITTYAYNKKLIWITDNSNMKTQFDRNFLRLNILPRLKNRWPKINYTIARSAQLCAEQEILLDELLKNELKKLYYHDHSLLLEPLINMSIQKRQALLRRWLYSFNNITMPSYKKLYHIWKNIILSKQDAIPIIQLNKEFLLRRFQNRLYIVPISTKTSLNNTIIEWNDIRKIIHLPNELGTLFSKNLSNTEIQSFNTKKLCFQTNTLSKKYFTYTYTDAYISNTILNISLVRAPYKTETVSIKFSYQYHENIYLIGQIYSKKIKKIWKELKIPPWLRRKIPLLFYNNQLITAVGIFTTQNGYIKKTDHPIYIYWIKEQLPTQINH